MSRFKLMPPKMANKIFFFFLMALVSPSRAQTYLGDFRSFVVSGRTIMVQADTSAVKFIFYKPNIVRVDFMPSLTTTFDTSLVVIVDTTIPANYFVADSDSTFTIKSSSLQIVCRKFPLRVGFYSAGGESLVKEPASGGAGSSKSKRIANFFVKPSEHFYGTGERGMSLDLRGQAFDNYNEQHGGYGSPVPPTMNVNIPFMISSGNYGIYFDDTYRGHFDVGNSNPNVFTYTADGGELSYYFICDSTMKDVLADYTWLTGRPPLLPRWAYGYIQSKYGYRNDTDASQMIQRMRNDSIPCDAIVLDLYWFQNMGDLSWNTGSWPNPNQTTENFLSQGFKTIVITEPYITQPSLNFSEANNLGYLAKSSADQSYILGNWWSCGCNAGLLDITNPAARAWWWGKYNSIFQTGVSGLWTDLGEPERDYGDMKFYTGSDSMVHNIYDFLWAKTLFEGFNNSFSNLRMFNLTRSGYAGIQRFGVVTWSGDVSKTFGGLAVQLPLLLNMGMSGIVYHNSDIGGFDNGSTTPELYARWMEFGAFCPVMRAHGYDGDNGTEPWSFGTQTEEIVRNIIKLRYCLLPYNYTAANEAYTTGMPMARPLVLEYSNDPNVYNESSAYLWGDDFLVAPVVQSGQTTQMLYLPQGKWVEYWTDKVYNGGTTVTTSAPLNEVPLFVKAGSIIPMQPAVNYVDEFPSDTMDLAIYPDPDNASTFSLYEDDGKTLAYQKGAFATTHFSEAITDGSRTMEITVGSSIGDYNGKPADRVYVCAIHKASNVPADVRFFNVSSGANYRLDLLVSRGSLDAVPSGYFYDTLSQVLYVKIPANADSTYSVLIDSVDITGIRKNPSPASGYELEQNYPNPFNPTTAIGYQISSAAGERITLKVYDVLGREIKTLVNEVEKKGRYVVEFDGSALSSGVYFYRLSAEHFVRTKAMVLLK
ncbi:MAG TPA: TIM-barrel domain-containing protein [Candidatus Acidoferrales bacterium]|nr:TIM-barrel domain-containing protein [Candidatus Acidoferrales bacterium]